MTHQHQSALRGLISELLDGHEPLEPGEAQRRLLGLEQSGNVIKVNFRRSA